LDIKRDYDAGYSCPGLGRTQQCGGDLPGYGPRNPSPFCFLCIYKRIYKYMFMIRQYFKNMDMDNEFVNLVIYSNVEIIIIIIILILGVFT
jgi:hypothetical protein